MDGNNLLRLCATHTIPAIESALRAGFYVDVTPATNQPAKSHAAVEPSNDDILRNLLTDPTPIPAMNDCLASILSGHLL